MIPENSGFSRRDFIRTASVVAVGSYLYGSDVLHAADKGPIRVGLIGCGGRGTGAAVDCVSRVGRCRDHGDGRSVQRLSGQFAEGIEGEAPRAERGGDPERCFTGWDAYKNVMACDVDLVILAAPPFFRPLHLAEAVRVGKHVFMEKPVAVDPAGVRSVIASAEIAKQKSLAHRGGHAASPSGPLCGGDEARPPW